MWMTGSTANRGEVHTGPAGSRSYGWWLATFGAVIMVVATVPLYHGLAVWAVVLSQNFGWTPLQMSWAFTLTRVQGTVLGPIAGWAVDKIGPRKVVVIGTVVLTVGWVLFSRVGNLGMFYTSFALASVGAGLCAWIPVNAALNNWFRRRLCTAMSIPLLGLGLGGVAIIPLMVWLIGWDPETGAAIPGRLGWRNTALVIGGVGLAMSVAAALLIRDRPGDYGQQPDGVRSDDTEPLPEYTFREAVKTRAFWLLVLGGACMQWTSGIGGPDPSMLFEEWENLSVGGYYPLVQPAVAFVFTLVGAVLGDRIPVRRALLLFTGVQFAGVATLLAGHSLPFFFLAVVLTGIGTGGRSILGNAAIAIYFGIGRFGIKLGFYAAMLSVVTGVLMFVSGVAGGATFSAGMAVLLAAIAAGAYGALGSPQPSPFQRQSAENTLGAS